jgi:hypothetical protein
MASVRGNLHVRFQGEEAGGNAAIVTDYTKWTAHSESDVRRPEFSSVCLMLKIMDDY